MKVVAAMSGGVDSAVAAARAAESGHEVTGVHLALSRNQASYRSGARGCCTIEDSNDARRAADVIGIPFYVWDLSDRFHEDVVEDVMAEYSAGRTPNPCLRCNEKIKVAAVRDRVPDVELNGDPDAGADHRLPGNAHFSFPGCEGDSLLMLLDARGIECSTGSACSAGVPQPSHVLLAMGCDDQQARLSLRFSLGHTTTPADIDALVAAIGPVVERARAARAR